MTASPGAPLDDDVRGRVALEDPHGFFRQLREVEPVRWSEPSRAWLITSYAEVADAFRDSRLSSDRLTPLEQKIPEARREAMAEVFALLRGWMVFADPPVHRRLRDPVRRAFSPRSIEQLGRRIEALVDELLDPIVARGECELIRDFAFPLPAIVIAELLGVPPEDRAQFAEWSQKLSGLVFGSVEQPNRDRAAGEGARGFTEYLSGLVRRYEKQPADNLVRALIEARDRGDSLSPEQMVGACTMLLFAGHETTTTLIATGVATLLDHPIELERLRSHPELAEPAIEELLRFEGPTKLMVRQVAEPHERAGRAFAVGERVYLSVAGANRDPDVFEAPDRLELDRDPNPHLAFGTGSHFCLGASLARIEARIAITRLLERAPELRLAKGRPEWVSTIIGRGIPSLPLHL